MHATTERESQLPCHLDTRERLEIGFRLSTRLKNQLREFERYLAALENRHKAEETRPKFDLASEVECLICLESIANPQSHRIICGHAFHRECIQAFFRSRGDNTLPCPVCRFPLYADDLVEGNNPDSKFESTRDSWQACLQPIDRMRAALEHTASWVHDVLEFCNLLYLSSFAFEPEFLDGLARSPFPELRSSYKSVVESVATYRALRLGKSKAGVAAFVQKMLQ